MEKYTNNISVIIRTKNSDKTIQNCLDGLLQQSISVREIIIVDSGSTDDTLNIVGQYNCKIVLYPTGINFNYSKALNIGIAEAKGNYVLVVSSHVILENVKTLEFMMKFLEKNNSICAVSTYRQKTHKTQVNEWKEIDWFVKTLNDFKGFAMFNPCSLFKKKHWEEHHFDEDLPTAEDCEWIQYFMKKYNYGAVVLHNPYVLYHNPYVNIQKEIRELVTIGRYIYPPILSFKNIFTLLTWASLGSLLKGDFYRVYKNYRIAFILIKENLGFKMKLTSNYNKQLK